MRDADFAAMQVKLNRSTSSCLSTMRDAPPIFESRSRRWEQAPEQWTPWLGVNLLGVLNASRLVLPKMIGNKRGSIVTIISDAGRVGEPRLEVYSAAKAGAAGFSRALAKSAGRHAVRVNCLAISATRTPATSRAMDNWISPNARCRTT